jgi:pimeloyl-ACP methyl ester carboxylesterase
VLLLLIGVLCSAAYAGQTTRSDSAGSRSADSDDAFRIDVPMHYGRVDLGVPLRELYRAAELEPPHFVQELSWEINVESIVGAAQLEALERLSGRAIRFEVGDDVLRITLDPTLVTDAAEEAERSVRGWFHEVADPVESQFKPVFGITYVTDDVPRLSPAAFYEKHGGVPERVIVLVHGLDEPGWVWRDAIAALRDADFVFARFEYPNDGPIGQSADLLAAELRAMRSAGVARIDVVAHSMGGLVMRDVLTRPAYYGGDGRGGDSLPAVDRLIMCGTPNHGAPLARLRAITEIKEQLARMFTGRPGRGMGFSDGAGEAAVDLAPDSVFLRRLNDRPLASHTRHVIIAGRVSPVTEEDVEGAAEAVREAASAADAPQWLRDWIDSVDSGMSRLVDDTARGMGDGVVTLDSARLEGVDEFIVVEANHLTMLVNVLGPPGTTPPAIPIILDHLQPVREPGDAAE